MLEPQLEEVRTLLGTLDETRIRVRVRQKSAKYFLVGRIVLRRTIKGLPVVPGMQKRNMVLKTFHDKAGHWQVETIIQSAFGLF